MSERLRADTNVVIYGLKGVQHVSQLLHKRVVFVSFITEVELLSYSRNTEDDLNLIKEFLNPSHVIEYTIPIKKIAIDIRKKYKLKLADAFVAASAVEYDLPLISADPVFKKITELNFFKIDI